MLLDSNLIIYSAQPNQGALRVWIQANAPSVSAVSKVEVLGFHRLTIEERKLFQEFFNCTNVLPVSDQVIHEAIQLRQIKKMTLGDALIAGTALAYNVPLATHNVSDFAWVQKLSVIDPLGPGAASSP